MTHALLLPSTPRSSFSQAVFKRVANRYVEIGLLTVGLLLGIMPFVSGQANASVSEGNVGVLENGVYIFGESAEAEQLGQTYVVMEVKEGDLIGGFYQPSSSFDCFHGTVAGNTLALTVMDSYEQAAHPYSLALETNALVAAQDGSVGSLVPSGFQALSEISHTGQAVLQACQGQF